MTEHQQSRDFVTSDLHLFHANIIKYSNRPFSSVGEMNEALIKNHNDIVTSIDTTYYLGDISFGDPEATVRLLNRMNGRKVLVKGNHDSDNMIHTLKKEGAITIVRDYLEYYHKPSRSFIMMMHYPIKEWRNASHGSIHLHGHCHGGLDVENKELRRMDIGVDSHYYKPILIDDVVTELLMRPKPARSQDRHTSSTP